MNFRINIFLYNFPIAIVGSQVRMWVWCYHFRLSSCEMLSSAESVIKSNYDAKKIITMIHRRFNRLSTINQESKRRVFGVRAFTFIFSSAHWQAAKSDWKLRNHPKFLRATFKVDENRTKDMWIVDESIRRSIDGSCLKVHLHSWEKHAFFDCIIDSNHNFFFVWCDSQQVFSAAARVDCDDRIWTNGV